MKTKDLQLLEEIRALIQSARHSVSRGVNLLQVLTNFEIGRLIIEHEQEGKERAEYGKALLKELSSSLTEEFGRGFSLSNLKSIRKFYLIYQERLPQKGQMPSGLFQESLKNNLLQLRLGQEPSPFLLSWSQYVMLISINSDDERDFYEKEASANGWTLPELKRQFSSSLYERLALSRDKKEVKQLSEQGQVLTKPEDVLKSPYVLEFLGLDEKSKYSESDLESAIIDKLQHFLLELGKGFLFEARQKRFTFDEDHFFVDLVLYNRLLRCYVLVDLKIGKLKHQDLGQMQMYVNYYDRYVRLDDEKPTIGIILCKKKRDALVEITLPEGHNIHAEEYQLYLPKKETLQQKLMEWSEESEIEKK